MGETASKILKIGTIKLKGIPMAVSNSTKVRGPEGRVGREEKRRKEGFKGQSHLFYFVFLGA